MVHKFKNKVDNFLFSEMPVDSMDYERKGGCFVTISKGVILTILFVIFGLILGLLVFYTTKHAYENLPTSSLEEFIKNLNENTEASMQDTIVPKHYRIIINPMLNEEANEFAFNGNVWITVTPNDDSTKTIELDVTNLDIQRDDVSVYRSRILSDLDFKYENDREKRSAEQIDDGVSTEDDQNLQNMSTEIIDSNATSDVEKESQELEETGESITTTSGDINGMPVTEENETTYDSSDPNVTEYVDLDNITTSWDGLEKNDSFLLESNPDDQTELEIDEIHLDTESRKLIIKLNFSLRKGHYYIVKVFFRGSLSANHGFVYTSYNGSDANNFIAATVTEPNHVSKVFPCFSNILNEVTFELNLIRHTDHQTVSVSKIVKSQRITNDWILDVYERTSPMKLTNFGFAITNIEPIIVTATPNVAINSYFRPTLLPSITFIDSEIPLIIKNFETYTNASYPLESISFFGLPNFTNDVIEVKHGLVLASESFFTAHGEDDKMKKSMAMSYLIGKLWIEPWENVFIEDQEWIEECLPLELKLRSDVSQSSAYYISEEIVEKRMKSMRNEQNFVEFNLRKFIKRYSDKDWKDIGQNKGLYLLEILQNFLTEPKYKMGIQQFFKFDGPTDFIETLKNLSSNNINDQSILMEQTVNEWSTQIGYPLIDIQKNSENIRIEQTEFGKSNSAQFWITPIEIGNRTIWLTNNSIRLNSEDDNWLTVKSNGYFRVNYDDNQWHTILNSLKTEPKSLTTIERAILMDDALNLAKYKYLDYSIAFKLLECWNEKETEYLPWKAAFDNLEFIYRNSFDLPINNQFNIILTNLTQRTYENIVRSPVGGISYKLKVLIKKWSCQIFALPDCIDDSKKDFQSLIVNDTLKRSQRSSADVEQLFCTVIRFGDEEYWHLVRNSFNQQNNHDYNEALVYSLGCSTSYKILSEYFRLLFHKDYLDYADAILRSMKDNQLGRKYALEFLYKNFEQLHEKYGINTLKILLKGIADEYDYQLFQLFFSNHFSLFLSSDKVALAEVVNTIKMTLNWKKNFAEVLNT